MPTAGEPTMADREMYDLKEDAARYYKSNQVPEKLEVILNSMFYEKPEDVYGRLSRHFEAMSLPAKILKVEARGIMDSTGNPAINCKMHCRARNESRLCSSASLSVGPELAILPQPTAESEEKEPTKDSIVPKCVELMESVLSQKLRGLCPMNQEEVDCVLRRWIDEEELKLKPVAEVMDDETRNTPTPSTGARKKPSSGKGKGKLPDKPIPPYEPLELRLQGCSAVSVTSLAALQAAANFLEKPTFEHLRNVADLPNPLLFPVPSLNIISGGSSSPGKLNIAKNVFAIAKPGLTMQESVQQLTQIFHQVGKILGAKLPVLPVVSTSGGFQPSFEKIEQPLDLIQEAATALGWVAGQDVFIGIDCAAHELFDFGKGKYEIMTGILKSADEIIEYYREILSRYPAIIALIDPLRKEDREQWPKCCETLSAKCYILGSDAMYGSMHNVSPAVLESRRSSGLALCPGGRVTLTDMVEASNSVRDVDGVVVLLSPPGDVCDAVFSDLAIGLGCDIVRFGSPSRGENALRLDRLMEIERLAKGSEIKYREEFSFPVIKLPTPPTSAEEEPPSNAPSATPAKKK